MTRTTNARVAGFTFWGSTVFSWLLLRGRMIPVALAWLGVVASVLLVMLLPQQIAGLFELTLAVWLITKGVAMPARRQLA